MSFKVKDYYYKKAKKEHYFARSVYKLEEIDKKYQVLKKSDSVLDLGYYPGSWMQYTSKKVGNAGRVVGLDIQEINKDLERISNVRLLQKDIFEVKELADIGVDRSFDVVLSDMAPNTTGIRSLDQDRSLNLVESVFAILPLFLRKGGGFVIKVFDSNNAQIFLRNQKLQFDFYQYLRPKSTRSVSKEFFVIGKGYRA